MLGNLTQAGGTERISLLAITPAFPTMSPALCPPTLLHFFVLALTLPVQYTSLRVASLPSIRTLKALLSLLFPTVSPVPDTVPGIEQALDGYLLNMRAGPLPVWVDSGAVFSSSPSAESQQLAAPAPTPPLWPLSFHICIRGVVRTQMSYEDQMGGWGKGLIEQQCSCSTYAACFVWPDIKVLLASLSFTVSYLQSF